MPTRILVDTTSVQTLTNKTLTAPTLTAAVVALASAPVATLDAATKGYVDGTNIMPLNNGSLAASVASNSLTVSLRTAGGAAPSASDPVRITFRSSTDADGALTTRTVSSSTSMTFASGSTIGTASNTPARIWVGLIDNAGTVEICAWNSVKTVVGPPAEVNLYGFTPNVDVSTTAEGSGTATSAHVLYATNTRSTLPFVLLGYVESTQATAGVWATAPSAVQTYRDGMKKTGDVVQTKTLTTGASATGTTLVPYDDTIPQSTEGDQYLTLSITPISAQNLLVISSTLQASGPLANTLAASIFQDATVNALATNAVRIEVAANIYKVENYYVMLAGTTVSTALKIRAGADLAGTVTLNGSGGTRRFGGVFLSFLRIEEVYA